MKLTKSEQIELQRQASARNGRADSARRARLVLLLADGCTWSEICAKLDCSDSYINRWSKRFEADRLAGLFARHAGRERYKVTERLEARVLAWTTKRKPSDGATHWSSRKLAAELGGDISHMTVARIWAKHGLKPHRLEGYIASNDPDFETKAAEVIGLYLNPPQHAAVFCVDEKTAIQALDRKGPVLPLSPGRAERHGFEYFRHGTLSLYAAFNTKTGVSWARLRSDTPRRSSSPSSTTSWSTSLAARRSTSLPTTSRRTRPSASKSSWNAIRAFTCISLPRTRPGSTRSNSGSPRSSAMSLPAACSLRCLT
jgi:transposase